MDDVPLIQEDGELATWLADPKNDGLTVQTKLRTSERVIARVTDGIYRQPGSALRELISNAWDADAQNVTILTDAPRFSRIYVRDDGAGMSDRTLARLLHSIGGSAKRRSEGQDLGLANEDNADLTPMGRKIIGKIGIGLFSVSQLARRFEIVTKVAGANYRLTSEIHLHQYTEDGVGTEVGDDDLISGEVFIRREYTPDTDAHGTDIILDDIRPRVRDILRSADRWQAVAERQKALADGDFDTWLSLQAEAPAFHSGYLGASTSSSDVSVMEVAPQLPWENSDAPDTRMAKFMDAVEGQFSKLARPDLANTLDSYLEMIWSLGLSAPVSYVGSHPFDLTGRDNIEFYWIEPTRGRGRQIDVEVDETLREAVSKGVPNSPQLTAGLDPVGSFRVNIDGLDLRRPIRFAHHPSDPRGLQHAVMFVGEFAPNLGKVNQKQRGGDLELEGYLFWTGRIIPKENNGVLIRIRGASGALFDSQFLKYQVSEQTRLRQITSEIFVQQGLDPALNIDRESFNYAHPHVQMVSLWLHGALRQLTNRLKDIAAKLSKARNDDNLNQRLEGISGRAEEVWRSRFGDAPSPDIRFSSRPEEVERLRELGSYVFSPPALNVQLPDAEKELRVSALVKVLAAFAVFEDRTYEEQQAIIDAILSIFEGGGK